MLDTIMWVLLQGIGVAAICWLILAIRLAIALGVSPKDSDFVYVVVVGSILSSLIITWNYWAWSIKPFIVVFTGG